MDEMRPIFPGYEIRPLKDFLSLMTSTNLPGLDAFIESMIALAVSIGFLVILLSMYTTVIERTRDIGVLKSIGASKGYIIRALLGESVFICVIGIGVGIAMSYVSAQRVSFFISDAVDSDYARMDCAVRADRLGGRACSGPVIPRGWPAARMPSRPFPTIDAGPLAGEAPTWKPNFPSCSRRPSQKWQSRLQYVRLPKRCSPQGNQEWNQ